MAPAPVFAAIVIHRAAFPRRPINLDGVPVLHPAELTRYLRSCPVVLDAYRVADPATRIDRA